MSKRKVSVRLDEEIYNELMRSAEANKKTLSHEMNVRLSDAKVMQVSDDVAHKLRSELLMLVAELSEKNRLAKKRGANVNQVAKQVNNLKTLSEKNQRTIENNLDVYAKWQEEEAKALNEMRKRVDELWQSLR
ncbi:TraY domain-containing protein [Enterococcus casseliflavus]|uniref:TraY domain-containing protein n=1 Tax=Enterococcus casseliflavus TaxID=37734 RepID=UPI0035CB5069